MEPRALFNVLVRATGLYYMACALGMVTYVVFRITGCPPNTTHTLTGDVCGLLYYLIIGSVLLFGADLVAGLIFGRKP